MIGENNPLSWLDLGAVDGLQHVGSNDATADPAFADHREGASLGLYKINKP